MRRCPISSAGGETEDPVALFFLVGPLRTGSSLLSRCIDDHPDAICLCETDINRTLFPPYILKHHSLRMEKHGFGVEAVVELLDRRPQDSVEAWRSWYGDVFRLVRSLYGKPGARVFGDKSPDFFTAPAIVESIAPAERLIYSGRDPHSIWKPQEDSTEAEKEERWKFLKSNIRCWKPHWDRANLLTVRYEDLVSDAEPVMARVYRHLSLGPSTRILETFERANHRQFLWDTAVDWTTGAGKAFDRTRVDVDDSELTVQQRAHIYDDPDVAEFMDRFGY